MVCIGIILYPNPFSSVSSAEFDEISWNGKGLNTIQLRVRSWDGLRARRNTPLHYGTKPGHFQTSIIHFLTSEEASKVSERANEWAQRRAWAKQAVRSKRMSEGCERTDEPVAQYLHLDSCLFRTIVHWASRDQDSVPSIWFQFEEVHFLAKKKRPFDIEGAWAKHPFASSSLDPRSLALIGQRCWKWRRLALLRTANLSHGWYHEKIENPFTASDSWYLGGRGLTLLKSISSLCTRSSCTIYGAHFISFASVWKFYEPLGNPKLLLWLE